jgi:hypothetical protein
MFEIVLRATGGQVTGDAIEADGELAWFEIALPRAEALHALPGLSARPQRQARRAAFAAHGRAHSRGGMKEPQ